MKLFLAPTAFLATSVISQKILKGRGWLNVDLTNPRFSDGKYFMGGDWNLPPSLSIDGEMYGGENWRVRNFYGPHNIQNIFAHSASDKEPEFIVDVASNAGARISEVTIHPRQDCCWDRYSGMEVFVVSLYGNDNRYKCEARSSLDAEAVQEYRATSWENRDTGGLWWKCPDLHDVKSILVKNSDWIAIAEIEASGEILHPEVEQLTLSNPRFSDNSYWKDDHFDLPPKLAIDGKWIGQNLYNGYAHSAIDSKSKKFLVDLPGPRISVVEQITLYPRPNCCYERYANITVKVGDTLTVGGTCTTEQDLSAESVFKLRETGLVFNCKNAAGYEIVVENPSNVHLHIAEIVAIGRNHDIML